MNSRNPKTEARELGKLKNPPIVCVCRHYDKPIPKWKADLHAFALSFLPAVVAFHAALAASGAIGPTFCIGLGLYAIMFFTVVSIKELSKGVVDDKAAGNKVGISLLFLVPVAFLPAFTKGFGGSPTNEAWAGLAAAAATAIISQKFLALDPKYLVGAKKSPPLFSDREKRVWQKAAAVYGILVVAALPRLLPENILNIPWQVGVLFAGGAMLAGVILALFYWRRSIRAVLLALIYRLYRRFK